MKYLQSVGVLTLALALVPALKAWPTAPEEEPSVDEEFSFLGRIEFPCGPDIDEWIINVGIGNPPQVLPMLIDTTTNISFVSGKDCTTDFCLAEKRFDSSLSTTIQDLNEDVRLIYEDTEEIVEGKSFKDQFLFGNLLFDDVEFIDAYNTSNLTPVGYAGSFAIGFSDEDLPGYGENGEYKYEKRAKSASLGGGNPPSLRGGAGGKGRRRKRENTGGDDDEICSLDFGVDYDAIKGEIAWFDLPKSNFGATPLWKTPLNAVKSGDCLDLTFTDTLASFDSSVSGIEVSASDLDKIHEALGATCSEGSTEYLFKCSEASDLTFSFDKYDVTIPVDAWVEQKEGNSGLCNTTITKTDADDAPTNRWHLGLDFLGEFYSIYSLKREQTGLGLVVDGSEGASITPK